MSKMVYNMGPGRPYMRVPTDDNHDGKISNRERYGDIWAFFNPILHGLGSAYNDVANTVANTVHDREGYKEYVPVTNGVAIKEPESTVGEVGSALTRFGTLYGLPFGALSALGVPALAALPASGAAMGYTVDPTGDAYITAGEMVRDYGPESWHWEDPLVRNETDTELTRRLKGAASGGLEGLLLDVPAAVGGWAAAAPIYGGYMFGAPAGLSYARQKLEPYSGFGYAPSGSSDEGWYPEGDLVNDPYAYY